MKNTPEHILFGSSGCLSREGLLLFADGKLNDFETAAVKSHLQTCEFCAMAIEGIVMANPEEFNHDLEAIYASLQEVNVEVSEEEPIKAADNQEVKKMSIPQKSFFRRYRLEMIAAALLLLIVIGARQIYVSLTPGEQQSELVHLKLGSEDVDELEVIQKEITRSEPLAEERMEKRPTPLEPVQISVVFDDQEVISTPGVESSNKNSQKKTGSDEIEEGQKASDAVIEMQGPVEEQEVEGVEIFTFVEDAPEFPGGDNKRIEFLTENIKYPQEARELGVQGTVYVGFVVEKDGSIKDAKVLRGIGKGCEDEALRVIRLMPKWKPGTQRRRPVRVQITLPITFTLA